jgi:hypothetical protein
MERKKSKDRKTGIIGKKKGGTAVAFRPQVLMLFLQGSGKVRMWVTTLHMPYGLMI